LLTFLAGPSYDKLYAAITAAAKMSIINLFFVLSIPLYLWVVVAVAREIFSDSTPKPQLVMAMGSLAATFHVIASVMQMHSLDGTDFSLYSSKPGKLPILLCRFWRLEFSLSLQRKLCYLTLLAAD